jgi:hypothetical protein
VKEGGFTDTELMLEINGQWCMTERSEVQRHYVLSVLLNGEATDAPYPEIVAVWRTEDPAFPFRVQICDEVVRARRIGSSSWWDRLRRWFPI